ncbi:RNA-binding protein Nrd1 [Hysterangium stoloniferum]|nr:RNA-binding protein Nrd1 [Hysterangium stoloniferum]
MDDSQQVLTAQYPGYSFELDMMKRSMDQVAGPESAKKPRWSSDTSAAAALSGAAASAAARNNASFENYGYGSSAFNQQNILAQQQAQQLYATPMSASNGQNTAQISPNTAAAFAQQQSPTGNGPPSPFITNGNSAAYGINSFGYGMGNMMGMGMLGGFPYSPQVGSFQQQQRPNPLSISTGQAAYSPAAAAAAAAAANNQTGRTVYVGNLPADASVDELLSLVRFGPLESVRVLPEKSCVFISFLDGATAAAFHADATVKKLSLHGQELKIGWGKASPVPSQVMLSITQSNASRNVYLGGLDENMTEEQLRDDLSRFGLIDQVKIVRDKNIGFVHFLSISTATKVVATLPTEPAWAGKRVNYGKDRCAYVPKSQQAAAAAAQVAAAQSLVAQSAAASLQAFPHTPFSPYPEMPATPVGAAMLASMAAAGGTGLNRTVYLGNIHPETTPEDLCNAIRGGVLQSIRFMPDKHIAFVTFVDPSAAFTFYQVASYQGLTLNNRRLKIGWGKNSGPLAPALALAVHSGATRNVYIGNIEDFDTFNDEKLKRDFGEYGDIELINFLKEKNCAFVNFTNISNAIKAIDSVKNKPDYANLRIAHGKDRCANPPRSGPQGASGGMRRVSGNSNNAAVADGEDKSDAVLLNIEDEGMLPDMEDDVQDEPLATE